MNPIFAIGLSKPEEQVALYDITGKLPINVAFALPGRNVCTSLNMSWARWK